MEAAVRWHVGKRPDVDQCRLRLVGDAQGYTRLEDPKLFRYHKHIYIDFNSVLPLCRSCRKCDCSFYSFDVASVHVVVLNPYTATGEGSNQHHWLLQVR